MPSKSSATSDRVKSGGTHDTVRVIVEIFSAGRFEDLGGAALHFQAVMPQHPIHGRFDGQEAQVEEGMTADDPFAKHLGAGGHSKNGDPKPPTAATLETAVEMTGTPEDMHSIAKGLRELVAKIDRSYATYSWDTRTESDKLIRETFPNKEPAQALRNAADVYEKMARPGWNGPLTSEDAAASRGGREVLKPGRITLSRPGLSDEELSQSCGYGDIEFQTGVSQADLDKLEAALARTTAELGEPATGTAAASAHAGGQAPPAARN